MLDFYTKQLESENIIAWILEHQIKTERGIPVSFENHSFMIDPYLDWTPEQGTRKASQCGWSTMTNLKLFYSAKHGIPAYGLAAANVIYTLPSDQDVNSFVPSKTNLMIKNNPVIQDYLRDENGNKIDVDSIQRKKIGDSMVYFKGTRSKTAALMLSSDLNIHDESDRSEKFIIDEYESRLANSLYKGRWIFSNPEAPNMPADLMFLDSDQKYWFIKCEWCGHWQYLDWKKLSEVEFLSGSLHCYIDDTKGQFVCGKCARPISDNNRRRGKWVKKYRDRKISGYWVTHLMYPQMSAAMLLETEKKKTKGYFMNFVLGLPYVGSDVRVDSQTIVQNIVLDQIQFRKGHVAMGVDNGDVKHYVIGDERGAFLCGKTKSWDDIEMLIQKFEPVCVIDLNPYPAKPRELAAKYRPAGDKKWRVFCSFYIEQSKNYELIDWGEDDKAHMVYPVRNMLFDDLIAYIHNGNMKFYGSKVKWEEYIAHWETMYRGDFVGTRRAIEVSMTQPHEQARGVWLSSTGMDHYAHATLYYYVALSKIINGGGQVLRGPQEPTAQLQKDLLVKRTPMITQEQETGQPVMSPQQRFIKNLTSLNKPKRKSGAVSDSIK